MEKLVIYTNSFLKGLKKQLKKNNKTIMSLCVAIFLPWILTLLFVISLDLTHGLSNELFEDLGLLFRITIFYTFNLSYDLPILGTWFWPTMFVWCISGFLIGFLTKRMDKSLIFSMIGISFTYLLYILLVLLPTPAFPNDMKIDSFVFTRLYSGFSMEVSYFLIFHILFFSFAVPLLILFTLLGNTIQPKFIFHSLKNKKRVAETKDTIKIKPKIIAEPEKQPEVEISEKTKLKGFPRIIDNQLNPLNSNAKFKEEFKNTIVKILLNPTDQMKAALININNGTVRVEEIKKFDLLMQMKKKQIGFNAMLQVTTQMLFDIATGKMSTVKLLKASIKDKKIKVKGKLKLVKLQKAFKILAESKQLK